MAAEELKFPVASTLFVGKLPAVLDGNLVSAKAAVKASSPETMGSKEDELSSSVLLIGATVGVNNGGDGDSTTLVGGVPSSGEEVREKAPES